LVATWSFVPAFCTSHPKKGRELPGGSKPQKEEYQFLWVIATTNLLHKGF
jgi:hypothetical protein